VQADACADPSRFVQLLVPFLGSEPFLPQHLFVVSLSNAMYVLT
jgi:hypothetical protein